MLYNRRIERDLKRFWREAGARYLVARMSLSYLQNREIESTKKRADYSRVPAFDWPTKRAPAFRQPLALPLITFIIVSVRQLRPLRPSTFLTRSRQKTPGSTPSSSPACFPAQEAGSPHSLRRPGRRHDSPPLPLLPGPGTRRPCLVSRRTRCRPMTRTRRRQNPTRPVRMLRPSMQWGRGMRLCRRSPRWASETAIFSRPTVPVRGLLVRRPGREP